ncbi:MAG: hypothetical protein KC643_18620, partial [Nitrospira sp.]|nr:hypothetical protein [Nitrospira sp.]
MDSTILISCLVFVGLVLGMVKLFRRMRRGISQENVLSQQVYIDTCQFPFSLTGKVSKTYPHLSSIQVESVMKGLRQFFQ